MLFRNLILKVQSSIVRLGQAAVALFLLVAVFSFLSDSFLKPDNLLNILHQTALNALLAIGMTFVMISGGIDLSVGSVVALSSVIFGGALCNNIPIFLAIILVIIVSCACGLGNGIGVSLISIPPFIVTLGMMSIARGLALILSGGRSFSDFPIAFYSLRSIESQGIPLSVFLFLFAGITAYFALKKTQVGKHIYATGGNEKAASLMGIRTHAVKIKTYVICSGLAGVSGIILTLRLASAQPTFGVMYELNAIAAAVIGGVSLRGGYGSILGAAVGALIIGTLRNGLTLLNVNVYIQQLVIGAIIIFSVAVEGLRKKLS